MNTTPTTCAVTQQHDFLPIGGSQKLFSVRGGIPLHEAFNELSVFISTAQGVIEAVSTSDDEPANANWAASRLLDFTQALVQSMHKGLMAHEKGVQHG